MKTRKSKYDWSKFQVGEDLGRFFPKANRFTIQSASYHFCKYHSLDWKFSTVKTKVDGIEGVRVWRVK